MNRSFKRLADDVLTVVLVVMIVIVILAVAVMLFAPLVDVRY